MLEDIHIPIDQVLRRKATLKIEQADNRNVRLALSSETPVDREFGREVLVHDEASIRLGFLASGRAPVLLEHDRSRQIGVVECVELDGGTRRLRANVRFSSSAVASEVLADIRAGIRTNVSVGYRIHKVERSASGKERPIVRVTDWEPMEVSIVSVPADISVGVGRSAPAPNHHHSSANEVPVMTDQATIPASEIADIYEVASRHDAMSLAGEHVRAGGDLAGFQRKLFERLDDGSPSVRNPAPFSHNGHGEQFDLGRFIRARLTGDWSEAVYERETTRELTKSSRGTRGMVIPAAALATRAPMQTGGAAAALVDVEHMDSLFIDSLAPASVAIRAGATMVTGLSKDISIPRETGRPAANWITEGGTISEGNPTFDNITLNATMLAARSSFTRQAMLQGLPEITDLLRRSMLRQFGVSLDAAALNGSGTGAEPSGILNTAGINSVTVGTAGAVTWPEVNAAWKAIMSDNIVPDRSMAWIAHPDEAEILRTTLKDPGSGQFLLSDAPTVSDRQAIEAGRMLNARVFETSNQPAGTITLGKFSDLFIGQFGGVDIVIDEVTAADTGTVWITAFAFFDIAVRHEEAFCSLNGI